MRKTVLLAIIVTICMGNLYSQMALPVTINSDNPNYDELVSRCIEPLDKSLIASGLLGERGFLFTDMEMFNGHTDSVISMPQWWQIYRQLYLASVSQTTIYPPDSVKIVSNGLLRSGIIPIALINLDYNQIKPYALDSNLLLYSDAKLYDVLHRKENPYVDKHMFAATALKDRIYSGQVTFRLDERFFITNVLNKMTSLEIDFDDGQGFRRFVTDGFPNADITVSYQQAGVKTLVARMTFSDQTTLQSRSSLAVASVSVVTPDESVMISGFVPYNDTTGYGTAYVLHGCGSSGLRKPIIVSDGFDPKNSNNFDELYDMLNKENFVEKAIAEGYDIVILDYDNGADYIQRNAMVMVSLINYVNGQLNANGFHSRLVVIGPSMGGLITRYALSYMEQNNMNHNTQLYVSFDSPHLGANIPLGDQFFIEYAADIPFINDDILNILDSPAARQMLIYHHGSSNSYAGHDPLRDVLLSDPCFSFPTQCRKIAIANGSGQGSTCLEPGVHMLSFNAVFWGAEVYAIGRTDNIVFESKAGNSIAVSGAKLYDGAPGGQREVNKEIEEKGPLFITKKSDPVCFIPVISSLALNTNDVNYRVHDTPDYPFPSSIYTPFDAIYAPDSNEEHVTVTLDNIAWIMDEIGAFDLRLQNQTINKATDFEARNAITTGCNVVDHIPEGDFVVQNGSGEVVLHSEDSILLRDGTYLNPWGTGSVYIYTSPFPCLSWNTLFSPYNISGREVGTRQVAQVYVADNEKSRKKHFDTHTGKTSLISIHPNPTEGLFTIEAEDITAVEVFDQLGQKVLTDHSGSQTVNASAMPAGIYFLKVETATGTKYGKLMVK